MPKKSKAVVTPKLAGQKVCFVGKFGHRDSQRAAFEEAARENGATVVDGEKTAPDVLVDAAGTAGKPSGVSAKVQKKYPGVSVVDQVGFYKLLVPTPDEFRALLTSEPRDWQFWHKVRDRLWAAGAKIDLTGSDLRKQILTSANFQSVILDDADFCGARLEHAHFGPLRRAKFNGAGMRYAFFSQAEDCSLRNVILDNAHMNPATFVHCDFDGAALREVFAAYTQAAGCTFRRANLTEAGFEQSNFTGCDFTDAVLSKAKLSKCDFAGANLSEADCTGGDFRNVKFINANLSKVNFRDANLSGADFTGATIDGADFTGANLTGAVTAGVDASKAKNFAVVAARAAGPRMAELAQVAKQSRKLEVSIELGLKGKEYVTITASVSTYGTTQYTNANHTHFAERSTFGSYVDAPTFEQGMLNLVDLWSKGTPRLETVKATAKQCPLKPKELLALARDAWCEALGVAIPTAAEWEARTEKAASAAETLRDKMLAELRGGSAGVTKFNAHSDKDREKLGKLHNLDFTNAKLAGVHLNSTDLQGTKFDGATLTEAAFCGSKLQNASFFNVKASKSNFAGCKAADASFVAATLTKCNLRAATFLRTNFKSADLTGTEFDFSDLRGADFTLATLTKVSFKYAKFDETTKFPAGFTPPDDMQWVGAGPHPGKLKGVSTAAAGSMDFDTFVKGLSAKIDPARVAKAAAMLKAERFQLFADVTDAAVAGIVKSQTSQELLYSCRLAADGQFGCGTQNVKPCGGLHGSLCKHLLVLVVGLAKAGRLDPATVDNWINLSKVQKPELDRDSLAETFLKYKSADAGEIDWRPTETLPEDFYAM